VSWTIAAGAVAVSAWLLSGEPEHGDVVDATYDELASEVAASATVYADHVDDAPNSEAEIDGVSHVPDVIVKSAVDNNLVIEVETEGGLEDDPQHALEQLNDFSTAGYRRLLVVPEAHAEAGEAFVEEYGDELSGQYYLASPATVTEFL